MPFERRFKKKGMQKAKLRLAAYMADQTSECPPHHWVIEEADGPTSSGTCKKCGVTQDHKNWIPELAFTN